MNTLQKYLEAGISTSATEDYLSKEALNERLLKIRGDFFQDELDQSIESFGVKLLKSNSEEAEDLLYLIDTYRIYPLAPHLSRFLYRMNNLVDLDLVTESALFNSYFHCLGAVGDSSDFEMLFTTCVRLYDKYIKQEKAFVYFTLTFMRGFNTLIERCADDKSSKRNKLMLDNYLLTLPLKKINKCKKIIQSVSQ